MKKIILVFAAVASLIILSCNNSSSFKEDHSIMNHDNDIPISDNNTSIKEIKLIQAKFTVIDPGVSVYMKELVKHYLEVKNALTDSDQTTGEAASLKMKSAIKSFDKSLLTAEQKEEFDGLEDALKGYIEQFFDSKDIEQRRNHFSMMSENVYGMVKSFGAGMILYHDHCPMAKNNQGAMWLSETKDIRNPYFGNLMMACGSVEEMFH